MLRDLQEFDDHEMVITLTDAASGLKGYIAIHNTKRGPAQGGTRMLAYASEDMAAKDALNLSRAMSYKCALASLPYGGGKAVIIADETNDREQVLEAYARMVERLNGQFKTGTDVGLTDADVAHMAQFTVHMMGVAQADRGDLNTSKTAALGVFESMKATLRQLDGSDDLAGSSVAIKGVGKLGGELARLLHAAKAKVIIADTDAMRCDELAKELDGITVVPVSEISQQQVDIYSPCALGSEFDEDVVAALTCRAVVGGANNQLCNADAGDRLFERGILYAPDYVTNAGGLIYVVDELEQDGFNKDRVIERVKAIQDTLATIFERSEKERIATNRIADAIAQERIKA